jgi:predicted Zn-dependent protease
MADVQRPPGSFTRSLLPWLAGAAALVLYLFGLHPWLSLQGLSVAATTLDWVFWSPNLQGPVYFLLTRPVLWLPPGWQIGVLNVLSAVCAAGAIALLARSVALLPQDRTTYQRMRNRSDDGLLALSVNWLPPVVACGLLAFQMTFWEHAIIASQESFNILLFAAVIWCLLEYRLRRRDAWAYALAFLYGLALTNNWAMLDFLPFALIALVWVAGRDFFRWRFMLKTAGCGLIGLLPYLLLPAVEAAKGWHDMSFWDLFTWQLSQQRNAALAGPVGWLKFVLPALAAVGWIGFRWSTHTGETSGLSLRLGAAMHWLMPALLLALNVWLFFDAGFSPRLAAPQFTLLPLYFLGALAAGYYTGYFLLLGCVADTVRRRRGALAVLAEKLSLAIAWALLLVPVAVGWRNVSQVQSQRQPALRELADQLARNLPAQPALVLSEDPIQLLLVQAAWPRRGEAFPHLPVHTRSLKEPIYHRVLAKRYPGIWKDHFAGQEVNGEIPPLALIGVLLEQAKAREIHYLHPSFGYYFEAFYPRPAGLTAKLELYEAGMIGPPELTPQALAANQGFWNSLAQPTPLPAAGMEGRVTDREAAGRIYSRAANDWGIWQQRAGRLADAKPVLELALAFYPSNAAARVNLAVNTELQAGRAPTVAAGKKAEEILGGRDLQTALNEFGGYDEPSLCFGIGQVFAQGGLPRQALLEFMRARALEPANLVHHLAEAEMYLQGRRADKTLAALAQIRSQPGWATLSVTNQILAVRLEALAHLAQTNVDAAERVVRTAGARFSQNALWLDVAYEVFTAAGKFNEALDAVEKQLALTPGASALVLRQAALELQLGQPEKTVAALTGLLTRETGNLGALELRAVALVRLNRFAEARADYLALQRARPASAIPDLGLAEIARREGKLDQAKSHLEKALKLAPAGSVEAARARALLKELEQQPP